ncbi:MAG: tRNA uridine-5-carboxymethylaminomethyl(34) synthesis GTPase MnmE [Candidatus Eremiobacteraeota bacterium]|nr:tRNA uridine-5-carboxymethylaminomethyl(34) synthesis GTPase MnmE [Candidatus Eremiobacteraeota bacterium]
MKRYATARIEHLQIAIPAGGEDAARVFYGTLLALRELPKPAELAARGGLWFRSGSIALHLGIDPDFHPAGKAHVAFACSEYASVLARLAAAGVAVANDALPFEGRAHCYVADPFGNRIELIDDAPSAASEEANAEPTIVAVATPPGQGAISVVRVSGSRARSIAARLTGASALAPRHATRVALVDEAGRALDDALALSFPAPHSATGEDVVEFHLHGAPVLAREVVRAAIACGARQAAPGEFTRRAFLAGKLDLDGVGAIADLIAAESASAARAALANLGGALRARVAEMRSRLREPLERLAASIDFPDEVEEPARAPLADTVGELEGELARLQRDGEVGRLLREGVSLAIVGPPNAGKSSLLNTLLGEERAIVSDIPGTTRDSIEERFFIDGVAVRAIDTAGIRAHADKLEAMGIERSQRAFESARILLLVLDASLPLSTQGEELLARSEGRTRIVFFNKADLGTSAVRPVSGLSICGSVRWPQTLRELRAAIAQAGWGTEHPDLERAHLAFGEQFDAVARALEALRSARAALAADEALDLVGNDLRLVDAALAHLSPEAASEEMLAGIFARFCIGK